ncbi:MAG: hypothetical protein DDT32_02093 [Syntrophomonadaceae bacterium]|nr:hypothetical protein [Bacillota bacterium]
MRCFGDKDCYEQTPPSGTWNHSDSVAVLNRGGLHGSDKTDQGRERPPIRIPGYKRVSDNTSFWPTARGPGKTESGHEGRAAEEEVCTYGEEV